MARKICWQLIIQKHLPLLWGLVTLLSSRTPTSDSAGRAGQHNSPDQMFDSNYYVRVLAKQAIFFLLTKVSVKSVGGQNSKGLSRENSGMTLVPCPSRSFDNFQNKFIFSSICRTCSSKQEYQQPVSEIFCKGMKSISSRHFLPGLVSDLHFGEMCRLYSSHLDILTYTYAQAKKRQKEKFHFFYVVMSENAFPFLPSL